MPYTINIWCHPDNDSLRESLGIYLQRWKMEYVTPIPTVPNEDDLCPIARTNFFSKVLEHFVVQWLLKFIGDKFDFWQYCGMKGNSITHYLLELTNFILHSQDRPALLLSCFVLWISVKLSIDKITRYLILITKLSDLGVPSWAKLQMPRMYLVGGLKELYWASYNL